LPLKHQITYLICRRLFFILKPKLTRKIRIKFTRPCRRNYFMRYKTEFMLFITGPNAATSELQHCSRLERFYIRDYLTKNALSYRMRWKFFYRAGVVLEPIPQLLNLQLQRQRYIGLERFHAGVVTKCRRIGSMCCVHFCKKLIL
jgi:hypothetical protein